MAGRKVEEVEPGIIRFGGKKDYQTVAYRIAQFRAACPIQEGWSIVSEQMMYDSTQIIFRAMVYDPMGKMVASGTAQEFWDSNSFNRVSAVEIAETSAVGRALAMAGWGGEDIATADEIVAAEAATARGSGFDGLEDELKGAGDGYAPPSMPDPAPSDVRLSSEADDILNALKSEAKANAEYLASALGEDVYGKWHVNALANMCLVEDGSIDDATSIDGLTMFIDGQKLQMKGNK